MTEPNQTAVTRRGFLRTGALAAAAAPLLSRAPLASAQSPARSATKVLDFQTLADVAKAEHEGEVVYYGHDGEAGIGVLLDSFKKDFPKIKTSYVRLQTGALYAKITAERSAGRPLCGDLRVERPGLQAHVAGLDLREVFLEGVEQHTDTGLAVVAVVDDLAFLLGLGDVGEGLEVQYLGGAARRTLRRGEWRAGQQGCRGGGERSGPQKTPSGDGGLIGLGHADLLFVRDVGATSSPVVA